MSKGNQSLLSLLSLLSKQSPSLPFVLDGPATVPTWRPRTPLLSRFKQHQRLDFLEHVLEKVFSAHDIEMTPHFRVFARKLFHFLARE